jgi:multimeric flavodoxin WrbA
MKILMLLGSPRKGGNTDILSDEFARGAREAGAEVEKLFLDDYLVRPIGDVTDVPAKRTDPRADDDFPKVFAEFVAADAVVFVSPVYWQGVTGQMKCFLDRLSCYIKRSEYVKVLAGKPYAVLTAFGAPDEGRWVVEPLKSNIEWLGGRYVGAVEAVAYKRGDIRKNEPALKAAFELGAKVAAEPAGRKKDS